MKIPATVARTMMTVGRTQKGRHSRSHRLIERVWGSAPSSSWSSGSLMGPILSQTGGAGRMGWSRE